MDTHIIELRADKASRPRRHAVLFLVRGIWEVQLEHPAGTPREGDLRAWRTKPGISEPWRTAFHVVSPGISLPANYPNYPGLLAREIRMAGKSHNDADIAVDNFNKLLLPSRTISIGLDSNDPERGHPALFWIEDVQDDDNSGGLTIRLIQTA